jgi:hypothetical protein
MSKENEKWQGEYISALGYRGKVTLDLESDNESVQGKFSIAIKLRDQQQTLSGNISGKRSKKECHLEIHIDKQRGMQMNAKIVDGGSYASKAMYGVTTDNTEKSWIGEGVWMLWNFANKEKH